MLENLDALVALATAGTVSEAATRLRLTQSAVSKRLAALQAEVGFRLTEPDGRRVRLTARAIDFLARAQPLVAELRALARPHAPDAPPRVRLALADSIASSWGPAVVRDALARVPGAWAELHAHRSVLVLESVRLGRYDAGVCTELASARDLVAHPLIDEPLVLVHSRLARKAARAPLVAIEASSATWRAIEPALRAQHPSLLSAIVGVESFAAVAQMARAGFGNGLVPLGLALDLGLPRDRYTELRGVARRIVIYTRKTVHQQASWAALRDALTEAAHCAFLRGRPRRRGVSLRSKSRTSENRSSSMSSTDV